MGWSPGGGWVPLGRMGRWWGWGWSTAADEENEEVEGGSARRRRGAVEHSKVMPKGSEWGGLVGPANVGG